MKWEVVIGLETHVQLATQSKIFSRSSTRYGAAPNTQANEVDMALPGSLPVLNRSAVECAIRLGLAVQADIAPRSIFARKNYFYPDLPKNYQISQYEIPVVSAGVIHCVVDGEPRQFELTRAHLEEDAGKSIHENFTDPAGLACSGIDLNRAGTPLLEIVSEPNMRSAAEAVAYAKALHGLVVWLGICDGNMQEGSFRIDANVSVRPEGQKEFGTRTETKNVNSFRFLERAILYEVERQIDVLESGGTIIQETRLYDADRDETRSMRSKEDAHDYRYFPDPDLPPLVITQEWVDRVRTEMPELPQQMLNRLTADYGLSHADAQQICQDLDTARYFEELVKGLPDGQAKLAANWLMGEVAAALNRDEMELASCPVSPGTLAGLLVRIADGTISNKIAREVFADMWQDGDSANADSIIEKKGLKQISDTAAIGAMVDEVIANHAAIVEEYRAGKQKAFNSLVGQVMKLAKGKANPAQVNELLKQRLDG
ncbi:Asp-tRNA(Asn)/Glu-tRNA(Gln) amidotransferase subunit GatB [Orrella marina]|uniref:Aspartyl/glutamyl-tRNA(Asn/Gln) amidotransferase subunit B n=1 Tax=Orrella marina TaxID=2163011 RepID=A0A2R4XMN2_9BURK|nr:Asp-tRNA(Asn)/Glu-tRNA(Gln) amidotransferase subunit GatB [Orrella marina]AWB35070.1 Asp-tRNA(Asn)/Glu-tRNA(Gln) amidotransferase GatCAB subunit B [Orrella marina]